MITEEEESNESIYSPPSIQRLVCGSESGEVHLEMWHIDRQSHLTRHGEGIEISLAPIDTELACVSCGTKRRQRLFRELRIGAPFALSTIVPTALSHTPRKNTAGLPSEGRTILGFTDSRQGSARLAVRLQQESERNRVRSVLYHQLVANRKSVDTTQLENDVSALRVALQNSESQGLRSILNDKELELDSLRATPLVGSLSWSDAVNALVADSNLNAMHKSFRYVSGTTLSASEFANFCLFREFVRRPKRMNSSETMGMVSLQYPSLENSEIPQGWPLKPKHWDCFLKLLVDFYFRDISAVDVTDDYLRWMGIPVRKHYVQGPRYVESLTSRQRRWPTWDSSRTSSRLPRLLRYAAGLDESDDSVDRVNAALEHAWHVLRPHLQELPAGYVLRLSEIAEFSELSTAAVCPYTMRVLDETLAGLSPYLPVNGQRGTCKSFMPPKVPKAYWRDESGRVSDRKEIEDWLASDANVATARSLGVWSNLNDRIVAVAPYFEVAEHSAQIDSPRLRDLEARFKSGELNVLSCSTTMEMGVDVGGLSAVVMNNAPPSSANYRQRAGRAGRRGEGLSFAVTLCPSTPHGERIFEDPLWPFTSSIRVPKVALDSERLVQRHVNSICLGTYLKGRDVGRLRTRWFFLQDGKTNSQGQQFIQWCMHDAVNDTQLVRGLNRLTAGTNLSGNPIAKLLQNCALALQTAMNDWMQEVEALQEDAEEFRNMDAKSPALLAIAQQRERLLNEYLLGELANRQFLPSYGFPIGIVSFNTITADDLRRSSNRTTTDDTESFSGLRLGHPSRRLELAIREYAPGTDVTIDGRVYESGGVTLNWHLPPNVEHVNEPQAIGYVWHCRSCGATGEGRSLPSECGNCLGSVEHRKYLQPAGFAVDIRHSAHNNVVTPSYIPVESPWISCPTMDWTELKAPCCGRFRYSDFGHLFHGSRGAHGYGYAVCLRCGRAASESGHMNETAVPDSVGPGHLRLRGGNNRQGTSACDGRDFAIQRGLTLGGSQRTDVFELQITDLTDNVVAQSIGVAFRTAFCQLIGIQEEEVGVAVRHARGADGEYCRAILMYDMAEGGNGYVAALRENVSATLRGTLRVLDCAKNCDAACHSCLVTFRSQFDIERLNRHKALEFAFNWT